MIIYKCVNNVNGKVYVGQTTQKLNERVSDHLHKTRKGSDTALSNAIRKYGVDMFSWEEIDSADSLDMLNDLEIYWIRFFKSFAPNGYNLTTGGENYDRKPESITKMVKTRRERGNYCMPESAKKTIKEKMTGRKVTWSKGNHYWKNKIRPEITTFKMSLAHTLRHALNNYFECNKQLYQTI